MKKSIKHVSLLVVTFIITVMFVACGAAPTSTGDAAPTLLEGGPSEPTEVAQEEESNQNTHAVKVFFSKDPESGEDFTAVFPVDRVAPDDGVAKYVLGQLVAGPTLEEQQQGYFSQVHRALGGESVCEGGVDFEIKMNKRGDQDEQGTATVQFCRILTSAGIGDDARIKSEIDATLKQFSTIKEVVILTSEGNCFGDMSGMNICLNP